MIKKIFKSIKKTVDKNNSLFIKISNYFAIFLNVLEEIHFNWVIIGICFRSLADV